MIFDPGPTSFCRAAHSCSGGRSRSAGVEAALGSIRACEASSFAETVATSLHRPDVKFLFFDRKGGKQKRAQVAEWKAEGVRGQIRAWPRDGKN